MASAEIKVAVESALHQVMADAAKSVYANYGIMIHSVQFSWADASTMTEEQRKLVSVSMHTERSGQHDILKGHA